MSLTAFALTAGLGTRLRPFTLQRAKPALPFLGIPLGLHSLRHLESLPVHQLYMNLHHASQTIRELNLGPLKLPLPTFADETAQILGSGGALANVIHEIRTPQILLLNGDEVYLPSSNTVLQDAYQEHLKADRIATLVTMPHPEVGKSLGGAWCNLEHEVQKFSKTPIAGLIGHHYVGYLFLHRRVETYFHFPVREENILYDTLTKAMAAGEKVSCYTNPAYWFETGRTDLFIDSTVAALDLLEGEKKDRATRDLLQFIDRFAEPEFVVEKSDGLLCRRISALFRLAPK